MSDNQKVLLVVEDDEGLQRQLKWAYDGYEVVCASDDEAELVDVDRLLVEVVGAHCDRAGRAFARAVAGRDDDLGVGLQPEDFGEGREAFVGPVRIRRKAEVERDHRGLARPKRIDRLCTISGAHHLIAFVGPFELTLQALIVFHDEKDGEWLSVGHARFR